MKKQLRDLTLTTLLGFCFTMLSTSKAAPQNLYLTKNGVLEIVMLSTDTILTIHSQALIIWLDYETTEFEISLPIPSLHSGIDSLDSVFNIRADAEIKLKGNLGIGYINTTGHPPINFKFKADLISDEHQTIIRGTGHLHHIKGGEEYACMLGLQFELNPKEIGLNKIDIWLSEPLKIQILQAVLKPYKY